jgi:hypothetical protein
MRIYIYKSEAKTELRAFTGDDSGSRLPSQFAPWTATGVVAADRELPFRLSREQVEKAINDCGFQLWRSKPKKEGDAN